MKFTKKELALIYYACDLALCDRTEEHQQILSNIMHKVRHIKENNIIIK